MTEFSKEDFEDEARILEANFKIINDIWNTNFSIEVCDRRVAILSHGKVTGIGIMIIPPGEDGRPQFSVYQAMDDGTMGYTGRIFRERTRVCCLAVSAIIEQSMVGAPISSDKFAEEMDEGW